jgi:hypothetical protein
MSKLTLEQMLGMFHLFWNSRFDHLADDSRISMGSTERMEEQAARMQVAVRALTSWPAGWFNLLDSMAREGVSHPKVADRQLVTASEARAPFAALERMKWSSAVHVPEFMRAEARRYLATRTVEVGRQGLYLAPGHEQAGDDRSTSEGRLAHLRSMCSTSAAMKHDQLTPSAVRQLFGASESQVKILRRLGVLRSEGGVTRIGDVDRALVRLNAKASSRRRSDHGAYFRLIDASFYGEPEFEKLLVDVLAGRVRSVYWAERRPSGVANIFVPAECVATFGIATG